LPVVAAQPQPPAPPSVEAGAAIFAERCVSCHGALGKGDGPMAVQANLTVPDLSDPDRIANADPADWYNIVTNGSVQTGGAMPPFGEASSRPLSEQERWDVVYYALSLPTVPEARPYTVTGQATNATTGARLPVGAPITLHIYNAVSETATFTTTVGADGDYRFADVLIPHGAISEVEARQDYAPFYTDPFTYPLTTDVVTMPVEVFDLTTDSSAIRIEQWHFIITPESESALDFIEIYRYSNASNQAYAPPPQAAGGLRTVEFSLPAGARDVSVLEGGAETTTTRTESGLAYTLPVLPGEHQITLGYRVPYNGNVSLQHTPAYPVDGIVILAPKGEISLSSPQFTSQSEQDFDAQTYVIYRGGPLAAGSPLALTVASPQPLPVGLIVGGAALALALIGVGLWWLRRSDGATQPLPAPATARASRADGRIARREALMQQIADLDDAHDSGTIQQAAYEKKRATLKRELIALIQEEA
jgi:mono/diheme cytochrome c family protein